MARPETLIPGNSISRWALDNDLVLPMIDTLVYVGQETDQDEGRLWLFKEPGSPPSPDEQDPSSEPPALIGFSDRQLHGIVDFDGLMQRLREIAVDHPLKPMARTADEPHEASRILTLFAGIGVQPQLARLWLASFSARQARWRLGDW